MAAAAPGQQRLARAVARPVPRLAYSYLLCVTFRLWKRPNVPARNSWFFGGRRIPPSPRPFRLLRTQRRASKSNTEEPMLMLTRTDAINRRAANHRSFTVDELVQEMLPTARCTHIIYICFRIFSPIYRSLIIVTPACAQPWCRRTSRSRCWFAWSSSCKRTHRGWAWTVPNEVVFLLIFVTNNKTQE